MIVVRYKGRLGNNLFQYCLGRILAEELGWELVAEPIPGFPRTYETVQGERHSNREEFLTGQSIPLRSILQRREPRKLVLEGWFQRYEYYRPFRDRIRNWLQFAPIGSGISPPLDVILHVRRTDYVQLGWALPFSFYEQAISALSPLRERVVIMTDDPKDPFFRRFAAWKPRFATGSPHDQLSIMTSAKRLVISQSSFSWWPTFLGNHEQIICPVPSTGLWAQNNAESANLIERDRFTCLPCHEAYVPSGPEKRHQKWRLIKRRSVLRINRAFSLALPVPPP